MAVLLGSCADDSATRSLLAPDAAAVAAKGATNRAPVAVAGGPYSGLPGTALPFDGSGSSDPDGQRDLPLVYSWTFGDGNRGTGPQPRHTYAAAGTYTVTLVVTDKRGLSSAPASTQATITSGNRAPVAVIAGPASGVAGTPLTFDGSGSTDPDGDIPLLFAWSFGDGGSAATAQPTHTYAAAGTYTVTLTVTDSRGASSGVASATVTINPPVAPGAVRVGNLQAASGRTYTAHEGAMANGQLAYGDRSGLYEEVPPLVQGLTYIRTRNNDATAAFGSTSFLTFQIDRAARLYVAYNGTTPPAWMRNAGFVNNGTSLVIPRTDSDGARVRYFLWERDVPAGTVTLGSNQDATSNGSAMYTVMLGPVTNMRPVANPGGPYQGTSGMSITFSGSASTDPDGDLPLRYAWNFGDGTFGTGATPSHTYAAAGTYTVRLTVTDARGARSAEASTRATIGGTTSVTFVGAGDIASCDWTGDEATAALLDRIPGVVYTLGDNVYNDGTISEYNSCYHPSWGRHKARTRPSAGNHEYNTPGAVGYYEYYGAAAGDPTQGYHSYTLGDWHIIVLNSNCGAIGGCGPGSPQEQWLRADLAANPKRCTLAYWHHPRFTSGRGTNTFMSASWQALYEAGAEIILASHEHHYERFAPQAPSGAADSQRGIRQFVVGTGGAPLYPFNTPAANSEVRYNDTHGVLRLTLSPGSYAWEFIPTSGIFSDRGSGTCH